MIPLPDHKSGRWFLGWCKNGNAREGRRIGWPGRWRQVDGMDSFLMIGIVIVVLMAGLGTGFLLQRKMTAARFRLAEQKAKEAVEEAKRDAEAVRKIGCEE